jgi:hypothetical protein
MVITAGVDRLILRSGLLAASRRTKAASRFETREEALLTVRN